MRQLAVACCELTGSVAVDMKFVLLHESRNDDGIKAFFNDVWELYVKVSGTASSPGCPEGKVTTLPADNAESVPYGAYAHTEHGV